MLSHLVVSASATPWTVAGQAPLSVGFFQARTLEWVAISFSTRKHRGTLNSALGCLAEGSGTSSQNDAVQLRGFPLT